jgi:hypothetical protein
MPRTSSHGTQPPRQAGVVLFLTAPERASVRAGIVGRLAQLGDVHTTLSRCDEFTARRVIREHRDYLRLLDDLGWAEQDPRPWFPITMPATAFGRALAQLARRDPAVAAVCAALLERLP